MRVAYVINQYPKVSHTFIRREILALERQGFEVLRVALRGWKEPLPDPEDEREREKTRYVLKSGVAALVLASARMLLTAPGRFIAALMLTLRMGWRADRPLPYHLAYLAEACRILPWLSRFRAEHVHAHFATNSAEIAMLLHALGGPPYSFTVHGTAEFDRLGALGIAEKVRRAAFAVSASDYGRSQLYRRLDHELWSKINTVHCGLEPAFHAGRPPPPASAPRVVCVGRLSEEKGQLLLVEAVHRLACKGTAIELVLAGDGQLRVVIERLIDRYALARQVRVTGWISSDRVREEILASRALVLPSFSEGLPVVIMEAMALGRPVLSTFVGGIPELVRPGKDGWLFPAGSVEALTEALEQLLLTPPEDLARVGESARARAVERHAIDAEAAKLAALMRRLHGGRAPSPVLAASSVDRATP